MLFTQIICNKQTQKNEQARQVTDQKRERRWEMVELKDLLQQVMEGGLQFHSHLTLMEHTSTSLKVHNLKVHMQGTDFTTQNWYLRQCENKVFLQSLLSFPQEECNLHSRQNNASFVALPPVSQDFQHHWPLPCTSQWRSPVTERIKDIVPQARTPSLTMNQIQEEHLLLRE